MAEVSNHSDLEGQEEEVERPLLPIPSTNTDEDTDPSFGAMALFASPLLVWVIAGTLSSDSDDDTVAEVSHAIFLMLCPPIILGTMALLVYRMPRPLPSPRTTIFNV